MRLRNTLAASAILILTGIISDTANAQQCTPCPPGRWSAGGTTTTCTDCGTNNFCPGFGAAREACPSGTTTGGFTRATSRADCTNPLGNRTCGAGFFTTATACQSCPSGTFQSATNHQLTSCNRCPAGQYQDQTGQTSCKTCISARHVVNVNQSVCCALHNNECLTGTVRRDDNNYTTDITNRGLTVQGRCTNTTGSTLESIPESSTGARCYCRARTSHGAVSSWGFRGFRVSSENDTSTCASRCANNWCTNATTLSVGGTFPTWGSNARWD